MSIKKTLIFLFILTVLGGYYYVVEVRMAAKKEAAEQTDKKLFAMNAAEIDELTLTRQAETIRVAKLAAGWTLMQPVQDDADVAAVENILTQLMTAERVQSITETSSDLAQFGLVPPELVVTVKMGSATSTLRFGSKTPTSDAYYAQVNESPLILTVAAAVRTSLDKSVYDVRDKTVLAFEPAQIKQATFTVTDAVTGLPQDLIVQQESDRWTIIAPGTFPADTMKMGAVLSTIKSTQIQQFVDETPDNLAQYGLDRPRAQVTLLAGAEAERRTLMLGNTDEAETGIYARQAETATVFLIPPDILEAFPKGVNDLRDSTLLSFNSDDVQQIELLVAGQPPLRLEKIVPATDNAEALWNIVQPQTDEAMTAAVRTWLWDAQDLKVQQFVTDDAADLSLYGLNPPQAALKIRLAGQEQPQELLLGNADVEQTGIYARLGGQNSVVLVKPEARAMLARAVNDFRDTKIFSSLLMEAVEKISLRSAETTLVLEKTGDGWQSLEPEKQALTVYKVNNLLYDLGALTFREDLQSPETDMRVYGLDEPEVEITLWEKGRKDGLNIQIGKALEGRTERYLKQGNAPAVYAIDASFLAELPKALTDLTGD